MSEKSKIVEKVLQQNGHTGGELVKPEIPFDSVRSPTTNPVCPFDAPMSDSENPLISLTVIQKQVCGYETDESFQLSSF